MERRNNSIEKIDNTNLELPNLNISSKPINEVNQKFYNHENFKALNEEITHINDYSSNQTHEMHSMIKSMKNLNKTKIREQLNRSIGRKR